MHLPIRLPLSTLSSYINDAFSEMISQQHNPVAELGGVRAVNIQALTPINLSAKEQM